MAYGRHLEKSKNGHMSANGNGLTDQQKIWLDGAPWPSEPYRQLKFPPFETRDDGR